MDSKKFMKDNRQKYLDINRKFQIESSRLHHLILTLQRRIEYCAGDKLTENQKALMIVASEVVTLALDHLLSTRDTLNEIMIDAGDLTEIAYLKNVIEDQSTTIEYYQARLDRAIENYKAQLKQIKQYELSRKN